MKLAALLLPLLLVLPAHAEGVAPVATYGVSTGRRTLKGLPIKRVVTDKAAWDLAMEGLDGAPPAPDFGQHVALLVVADSTGGTRTWLDGLALPGDGTLRCVLHREEPNRIDTTAQPTITAHVVVLAPFPGGVHLDHRTHLPGGGGSISRPAEPAPEDRDQALVPPPRPRPAPVVRRGGGPHAPGGLEVLLRTEATFPSRKELPTRTAPADPFPTLGLGFPRVRGRRALPLRGVRARVAERQRARHDAPPEGRQGREPDADRPSLRPRAGPGAGGASARAAEPAMRGGRNRGEGSRVADPGPGRLPARRAEVAPPVDLEDAHRPGPASRRTSSPGSRCGSWTPRTKRGRPRDLAVRT